MKVQLLSVVVVGAWIAGCQAYPGSSTPSSQNSGNSLQNAPTGQDTLGSETNDNFIKHKPRYKRHEIRSGGSTSLPSRDSTTAQNVREVDASKPLIAGRSNSPSLIPRTSMAIQLPNLPPTFPRYPPMVRPSRDYGPTSGAIWVGKNGRDNWGNTFPFRRDICITNLFGHGGLFIRGEDKNRPYIIAARFGLSNPTTVSQAIDRALETETVSRLQLILPEADALWGGNENAQAYRREFEGRLRELFENTSAIETSWYDFGNAMRTSMAYDQYFSWPQDTILSTPEVVDWVNVNRD